MRRLTLAVLLSGTALSTLPLLHTAAQAQEATTIPETVVTATRVPTPEDRVPADMTVITRQQIEERGYQTLAEAMQFVPGVHLVQSGGMGQQASLFIRGTSSRHTLVLIDGVPANDAADASGAFNFGDELLGDVERIEVLRGPASSLYGSSAIGGVVNIITRHAPADKKAQVFGEVAGGTQRTLRSNAGVAGTIGMFDYMIDNQTLSSQGFDITPKRMSTYTGERDGVNTFATTARLGLTPAKGTRIEALVRWRQSRFGMDNIPVDDPNYTGEDRRWFGQLHAEQQLFGGFWTTGIRIAANQVRRRYTNLPDSQDAYTSTRDSYLGTTTVTEWANTLRPGQVGPFADTAVAFGVTYTGEEANSQSGSDYYLTTTKATQHTTSGYANVQGRLFQRLDITAGLRHDAVTGFTDATTWRLGGVLALPEINGRIHASVGTGFAAPSLYQRFGSIAGYFQGNPDLKPERSTGWDVGAETNISLFGRHNLLTPGFTFYQNHVRDMINYNGAYTSLVNIDRADIEGAELSLAVHPAPWFDTTVAWSITEAFDAETHQRLPRRPEHTLSLTSRIAPTPRLVITPQLMFTGRSPEAAYASYDDNGNSITYAKSNPAGVVLNVTANWKPFDGRWAQTAFFLEGRNLGNSKWEPANGYAYPGRSLLVGTRFAL